MNEEIFNKLVSEARLLSDDYNSFMVNSGFIGGISLEPEFERIRNSAIELANMIVIYCNHDDETINETIARMKGVDGIHYKVINFLSERIKTINEPQIINDNDQKHKIK